MDDLVYAEFASGHCSRYIGMFVLPTDVTGYFIRWHELFLSSVYSLDIPEYDIEVILISHLYNIMFLL